MCRRWATRPRSTSAVNVHAIPLSLGSWRPRALIQPLSALITRAPARRTSIVSGKSQKPSRKPRTASSAATRPPFAPPTPSAIAATTSRRGSANSAPMTAAAKSSFSLRGPLSEKNPTLARTPASPSISSLRVSLRGRASMRQLALVVEEVSPGRRGQDDGQRPRLAVERVAPAVLGVAPRDFGFIDRGRIGVDGLEIVVDRNLPARAAERIGAGDREPVGFGGATGRGDGGRRQRGDRRGSGVCRK